MSSKTKIDPVDRVAVLQLIARRYGNNQKYFSKEKGIIYGTFRKFMAGDDTMPKLNKKIAEILVEEWEPTPGSYFEDLRLQLAAAQ